MAHHHNLGLTSVLAGRFPWGHLISRFTGCFRFRFRNKSSFAMLAPGSHLDANPKGLLCFATKAKRQEHSPEGKGVARSENSPF